MAEVERLAAKYLGYAEDEHDRGALLHGDFHPGSVMVAGAAVKVIDPEFTIYGPPGLDVGSLLSGFVLAYLSGGCRRRPPKTTTRQPSSGTPAKPMAARAGDLKTPTGRHDAAAAAARSVGGGDPRAVDDVRGDAPRRASARRRRGGSARTPSASR